MGKSAHPLLELDDPLVETEGRITAPPPMDLSELAQEHESDPPSRRPTVPPGAAYPMLRDSCVPTALADVDLESLDPGAPAEGSVDVELEPGEWSALPEGDLGAADGVPEVALSDAELQWMSLDGETTALLMAMKEHPTMAAAAAKANVDAARARDIVRKLALRGIVRLH